MVGIVVEQFGYPQTANNLRRMGEDAMDIGVVLNLILADMMRITGQVFTSGGRRGGGSWRKDSLPWLRYKERHGGDPRVGFFSGDLYESLTIPGDVNSDHDIDVRSGTIRFGSKLPYARTAQKHRPFAKWTKKDRVRWADMVSEDIAGRYQKRARRR